MTGGCRTPWSSAAHSTGSDDQAGVNQEPWVCACHPGAGVRGPLITGRWVSKGLGHITLTACSSPEGHLKYGYVDWFAEEDRQIHIHIIPLSLL